MNRLALHASGSASRIEEVFGRAMRGGFTEGNPPLSVTEVPATIEA
jgi:hypothetical protein